MSGKIDDFRIYDDVLSPLEISQLFAANDLYEELVEFQFEIAIEGSYDSVKVDGLPLGLGFDSKNLEVIGVPQEVGTFDLNISASNQAGTHQTTQRIIVEKTAPKIASVKPRNLSSNGALATAMIESNGGEDVSMTVFWGETNGEENPSLWDNNYTLDGSFSEGRVSQFIDNLDLGSPYYYRWMAS